MLGQTGIRRVQRRLVAIRPGHSGAKVSGHEQPGRPAKRLERVHVRVDPRAQRHVGERLHIRVGGERQRGHEQPRIHRRAGHRVGEAHRIARPVDLDRLTRAALDVHRRPRRRHPAAVLFVEERVPIRHPARSAAGRDVLVPQQQQRHRRARQLPVNMLEVRRHPAGVGLHRFGQQQVADLVSTEVRHLPETDYRPRSPRRTPPPPCSASSPARPRCRAGSPLQRAAEGSACSRPSKATPFVTSASQRHEPDERSHQQQTSSGATAHPAAE